MLTDRRRKGNGESGMKSWTVARLPIVPPVEVRIFQPQDPASVGRRS